MYGTGQGIAIVDIVQHVNVLTMGTPDLYGPSDPFRRATPRNLVNGGEKQSSSDPEPSPLSPNQTGNEVGLLSDCPAVCLFVLELVCPVCAVKR